MFTVATALTRLAAGKFNLTLTPYGVMTAGQLLQRINEILEKFYDRGTWRGVTSTVSLTSTAGIITLAAAYLRLDGLGIPSLNAVVPIKPPGFQFSTGGPRPQDFNLYGNILALDMGDNGSGQRQYQLTGSTDALDSMTFSGLARKRFNYITDTATVVAPDCYGAINKAWRAMNAEDEQADSLAQSLWAQAFAELNGNMEEFETEIRQVQVQPAFAMGASRGCH